jgi:hypothetical protein
MKSSGKNIWLAGNCMGRMRGKFLRFFGERSAHRSKVTFKFEIELNNFW